MMDITSFYFLCFYILVLTVYYLVPGKIQWIVLLGASLLYYVLSGNGALILYPIAACAALWLCMRMLKKTGEEDIKRRQKILFFGLFVLLGILFVLKYAGFIRGGIAAPLGLSFYTFILAGYLIDACSGIAAVEDRPGRILLMGMYFPLMISGPITNLRDGGEKYFRSHPFSFRQVTFGMQRMLWGFFKVLVISRRAALVADTVFDNYADYHGIYIWAGAVCFTIQLYTNFSGCMDIVLGLSETFGIPLPENFNVPFAAKTISEYWRRWHITLGVWMKEHVFYPLLRTKMMGNLGKTLRAKFGRKKGKQLTTVAAMFLLWLSVGLWHGGALKYVIGSGLLHWFYISFGELTLPAFTAFCGRLHLDMKSRGMDRFRVVRTFFLVTIGNIFFRADSALSGLKIVARGFVWPVSGEGGLAGFFSGGAFGLGLGWIEAVILGVSVIALGLVSRYQQRLDEEAAGAGTEYDFHGIRSRIARFPLAGRWLIWYALLFYVILLGQYGPDFSAAEFIYQGF